MHHIFYLPGIMYMLDGLEVDLSSDHQLYPIIKTAGGKKEKKEKKETLKTVSRVWIYANALHAPPGFLFYLFFYFFC